MGVQPNDAAGAYRRAPLRQTKAETQKVPKPMLGEDQLQEINVVLASALSERRVVDIKYWKDGFIKSKIATPEKIDYVDRRLTFIDEFGIGLSYFYTDK